MGRAGLFHLHLHLAIGRIHVVELFFTRGPQVGLFFRIKILVEVEQPPLTTQEQAQVVESGILIVTFAVGGGIMVQQGGAKQQQGAEVEVVAQRTFLVVDDGMRLTLPLLYCITVGIDEGSLHVLSGMQHALDSRGSDGQRRRLRTQ